jgi:PDZ domain-containing protein
MSGDPGWVAPERARLPRLVVVAVVTAVVGIAIVVAGFLVRLPYSTIAPGDAVSLTELVHVEGGRTFPAPRGDIRLLFVRERTRVNVWRYVQARLDPDIDLFREEELNPQRKSPADQQAEAAAQMAEAKIAATKLALEAAGYEVARSTDGLVVLAAIPSKPAGKVLKEGDVILAADGTPVREHADLRGAIGKHEPGVQVELEIVRDARRQSVRVEVAMLEGKPGIGVFVAPRYDFPVEVTIDTNGIGGPSGGLAMTLAIFDDLTPGNLTGGERVAVTGTIDLDGHVGEIGGIEQKAIAARARDAALFLVPACDARAEPARLQACRDDLAKATRRVGDDVAVVPVATFREALEVLRDRGGDPVTVDTTLGSTAA